MALKGGPGENRRWRWRFLALVGMVCKDCALTNYDQVSDVEWLFEE
jgi:hypothetical protein